MIHGKNCIIYVCTCKKGTYAKEEASQRAHGVEWRNVLHEQSGEEASPQIGVQGHPRTDADGTGHNSSI